MQTLQSCCSPIASASAAARRLRSLRISCMLLPGPIASASTAAPRLRPLPAAAPRLRPLQLLLHARRLRRFSCCSRSRPLRLLLPDCVRFDCCSPIACIRFQPQLNSSPMFSNILRGVRGSVNKLKYEGRASL